MKPRWKQVKSAFNLYPLYEESEMMWMWHKSCMNWATAKITFTSILYQQFIYIYIICTASHSLQITGINWTRSWPASNELVEHRTGIAGVMGSNPVAKASDLFSGLSLQLLKLLRNCEDHFHIHRWTDRWITKQKWMSMWVISNTNKYKMLVDIYGKYRRQTLSPQTYCFYPVE